MFSPSPIIRGETYRSWCHESGPFQRRIFPFSGEWSQLKRGTVRSVLLCWTVHTEVPCRLFTIWVICGCTDLLILLGVRKSELRKATNSFSLTSGSLIFYSTFCSYDFFFFFPALANDQQAACGVDVSASSWNPQRWLWWVPVFRLLTCVHSSRRTTQNKQKFNFEQSSPDSHSLNIGKNSSESDLWSFCRNRCESPLTVHHAPESQL